MAVQEAPNEDVLMNAMLPEFVVGIGASAGGLEALERLFSKMPLNTGLAFVIIQHLSPDFKSLMDELLARRTTIPVVIAEHGMPITKDRIYLMPPRNQMIIAGGKLLLSDKEPADVLSLPIDQFFRSLAQDVGRRAVGVILSGTGSDGSRGIRHIHDAGGLVLVQSEESAKFDGMPKSAVETGVVDETLPPELIPGAILRHINHPAAADLEANLILEAEGGMSSVFRMLRQRYGIDFSFYKPSTVIRRTERRLALLHLHHLEDYVIKLRQDPVEMDALYRDLLIGVTQFFRDRDAFHLIEKDVLPDLLARMPVDVEFRIWVAGCATGEEAYSLAILLAEELEKMETRKSVKIFATDVHRASLEFASAGLYDSAALANMPADLFAKYFTKVNERYQLTAEIRKLVVFAPHNIIKDAPFTRLDFISCRNLLIYLQPVAQRKALSLFHFGLKTGGVLFLGPSETPGELTGEFEEIDRHWRIFRKRRDIRLPADLRLPLSPGSLPDLNSTRPSLAHPAEPLFSELFGSLLEQTLPASVLLNEAREVVHSFGDVTHYLRIRKGRPSLDLLELLSDDLKLAVSSALQRAQREGQTASFLRVRSKSNNTEQFLDVTVRPVTHRRTAASFHLVSFEPVATPVTLDIPTTDLADNADLIRASRERVEILENELRYTRENLQATVEELETSNEEMQATNQELLASNEELQSTNEELHSVNEELYTVNAEYQKKIDELTELSNDMNNLLISTDVHTMFLDQHLCIRKFTPKMAEVFHLIPGDIGRRIDSFSHKIHCLQLVDKVTEVLTQGLPYEEEVTNDADEVFLLRILPYRGDPRRSGVVLTLIDISHLKQAEARFRRLFEVAPSANLIAAGDGRILLVNRELERMFGYTNEELLGQAVEMLIPPRFREQHTLYRQHYFAAPSIRSMGNNTRLAGLRKDGSEIPVEIHLGPLEDGDSMSVIASLTDVSDRQRLENSLQEQVDRRDQFLAMLSHELRNPLAAVLNAGTLLQREVAETDARSDELSAVIIRQTTQMARLLDDLLDVSRIAQGKITLRRQPCDLRSLAQESLAAVSAMIRNHQHQSVIQIVDQPVIVNGDQSRLLQVFENLLINAIKYTPIGGTITLEVALEPGEAVARIRDTGKGIPPEKLNWIFDLFFQGDDSIDRSCGGLGVGLTLVRNLVELHEGKVEVRSDGLNCGSEFTIRLPLFHQENNIKIEKSMEPTALSRPLRCVLIEDNNDACEMLASLLRYEGYEVVTANDGKNGLSLILETHPDIAIVDIGLPGLDGYQIAKQVRPKWSRERLFLVALTGYGRDSDRQNVIDAGFDCHMIKPIHSANLLRSIQEWQATMNKSS